MPSQLGSDDDLAVAVLVGEIHLKEPGSVCYCCGVEVEVVNVAGVPF